MTSEKDMIFYTELVTVTVVALVAANAWIDLLQEIIRRLYPHNITVLLITAVIITGAAIFMLHILFGKKSRKVSSSHMLVKEDLSTT